MAVTYEKTFEIEIINELSASVFLLHKTPKRKT